MTMPIHVAAIEYSPLKDLSSMACHKRGCGVRTYFRTSQGQGLSRFPSNDRHVCLDRSLNA